MHKPFAVLEELVRQGRIHLATVPDVDVMDEPEVAEAPSLPADLSDEALFEYAMRDVKSLGWSDVPLVERPPLELEPQDDEQDALRELEEFMRNGNIAIEKTPEYIEGASHPRGRLYLSDLRSGRFAIQAHLDLHGLTIPDARFALDEFILESVRAGFRCVRVIH